MYICEKCGKEFSSVAKLGGHSKSHSQKATDKIYSCKFCGIELNWAVLGGHVSNCSLNPNRELIKAKRIINVKNRLPFKMSKEAKEKISIARSKVLEERGGGGFSDVKWYPVKNTRGEDFICRGTWEVKVAEWLNSKNVLWVRKVYLQYVSNEGLFKTYVPDFYLPEYDIYIEVKGFFSEKDLDKLRRVLLSNNIRLCFVTSKHIKTLDDIKSIKDFINVFTSSFEIVFDEAQAFLLREKKKVILKQVIKCCCGNIVKGHKYCSAKCYGLGTRKVARPSKDQLEQEIALNTFVALGKKYGVTDSSVRKWAFEYGLDYRKYKK